MISGSTTRRVFVTGVGTVNSIAGNTAEFSASLKQGRCGIAPISAFPVEDAGCGIAAEVRDFDEAAYKLDPKFKGMDRFCQFAGQAAVQAVSDARLDPEEKLGYRSAVILGTGVGGHNALESAYRDLFWDRKRRLRPPTVLRSMAISGAGLLSIAHGIKGPCLTINTACAAGAHSIGLAYQMIKSGIVDIAIAGGSEAPITLGIMKAWDALRVLSPDGCRPFSNSRNGLVLGEGAGIVVLEAEDRTGDVKDRATAEMVGFGMTADAIDLVNPSVETISKAMSDALEEAGVDPGQVDCINAHGTGTRANDVAETQAIRQVYGSAADQVSVSSTKSMHGHCLGSGGAVEAIAALVSLREQFVPPTINLDEPDPECDLDYTANVMRERSLGYAMSNSFAFGGTNAVLLFSGV